MEIIPFKEWSPEKVKEWQQETSQIDYSKDMTIVDVMVYNKLASSKNEARRLIQQKGVKINGRTVLSPDELIEPGELKVGKLKLMSLGNYMRMHVFTCSNGSVSIEVSPLLQKKKGEAIADAIAATANYMSDKGYVGHEIYEDDRSQHFALLISKGLINYFEQKNGIIDIDLSLGEYLKPLEEVQKYVTQRDEVIQAIKDAKLKGELSLDSLKCPRCKKKAFRGAYNKSQWDKQDQKYNINGVCDECGFKLNELA